MNAAEPVLLAGQEEKRADCAKCGGERNCHIHGTYEEHGGDEDFQWNTSWYILQCKGCDYVFVQTVSTNSEDYDNYYEHDGSTGTDYHETIGYWPALSKREKPEWMSDAGIDAENVAPLDASLIELYGALNNDLGTLAAIGMRTALDIASELLGVDSGLSFQRKLDALVEEGHIGKPDRARLETLVDGGSASAHRGWKPSADELATMMEVLEHFVHDAFVAPARKKRLDEKAEAIRESVPKRSTAGGRTVA